MRRGRAKGGGGGVWGVGKEEKHTAVSHSVVLFVKDPVFESSENSTVSAAILLPAVSVSDVMNRASMCSETNKLKGQHFSVFIGKERTVMAAPLGGTNINSCLNGN